MKPVEIASMSIFGFLLLCAIALLIRQSSVRNKQAAQYAEAHGYGLSPNGDAGLEALLKQITPDLLWATSKVMAVDPGPRGVYLFAYHTSSSKRIDSREGFASLAAHELNRPERPVKIFYGTPLLGALTTGAVKAGGHEFRKSFMVTCADEGTAMSTLNGEIERMLLDHYASPGWTVEVTIGKKGVVVQGFEGPAPRDWDHLIALAKRLRGALQ